MFVKLLKGELAHKSNRQGGLHKTIYKNVGSDSAI
jgi:hypothetical protein